MALGATKVFKNLKKSKISNLKHLKISESFPKFQINDAINRPKSDFLRLGKINEAINIRVLSLIRP